MYKALVLVATVCVALTNASHHRAVVEKVNNRFALAMANQQAIREKHNLRTSQRPLLTQDEENVDGDVDLWDCARGFAKGLQFSSSKEGACYISLDESINAADDLTSLIKRAYDPTVWADIMSIQGNYVQYLAAVNSNCDIQKLLNTLTTSASTLVPQLIARIGGGFVAEIPDRYYKMKTADTCYNLFFNGAKIFSLVFDYYI